MQDIIANLVNPLKKVVFVWGWPGIGKSTILRDLANFFSQRDYFSQGVLYLNITQIENFRDLLEILDEKLIELNSKQFIKRTLSNAKLTEKQLKN